MKTWINVNDESTMVGECLVFLEKEFLGSQYAVSVEVDGIRFVGGHHTWIAPTILFWKPLNETAPIVGGH